MEVCENMGKHFLTNQLAILSLSIIFIHFSIIFLNIVIFEVAQSHYL